MLGTVGLPSSCERLLPTARTQGRPGTVNRNYLSIGKGIFYEFGDSISGVDTETFTDLPKAKLTQQQEDIPLPHTLGKDLPN